LIFVIFFFFIRKVVLLHSPFFLLATIDASRWVCLSEVTMAEYESDGTETLYCKTS